MEEEDFSLQWNWRSCLSRKGKETADWYRSMGGSDTDRMKGSAFYSHYLQCWKQRTGKEQARCIPGR